MVFIRRAVPSIYYFCSLRASYRQLSQTIIPYIYSVHLHSIIPIHSRRHHPLKMTSLLSSNNMTFAALALGYITALVPAGYATAKTKNAVGSYMNSM